mmetsp:Transcript_6884/g.28220  ORF Transcript_6884/g.28220 Transcript_6884/m.28220 type:complete len:302 (+) Transcript_6884:710-1615(+)
MTSNGYVTTVAVAPATAPPRNASGGFSGSPPFSRATRLNSPSAANCTAVYGTHRNNAGTVPAHRPRAPSSFRIVRAHCAMPRYLPAPRVPPPPTGSTWTCMRILITSRGATTTRLSIPANAPAIMESPTDASASPFLMVFFALAERSPPSEDPAACALRLRSAGADARPAPRLPRPSARRRRERRRGQKRGGGGDGGGGAAPQRESASSRRRRRRLRWYVADGGFVDASGFVPFPQRRRFAPVRVRRGVRDRRAGRTRVDGVPSAPRRRARDSLPVRRERREGAALVDSSRRRNRRHVRRR